MDALKLILITLQDESVYGWIISVVGASITSLRPQDDDNDPKTIEEVKSSDALIKIIFGTIFSKFLTHPFADAFTFFLDILPVVYLIFGLIGNGIINTIVAFFKKLGKNVISDDTMNTVMDYLKSFIIRKQNKDDGLQ